MIKLKSLFRRGQTPSQNSSSSTKHSSNNNRNKSQSTQSLNTAIDNEDKQNAASSSSSSTKFYPAQENPLLNIEGSSAERGVDVGDDQLLNSGGSLEHTKTAAQHANTLPHKKQKGTTPKKGQKQPKPLPATPSANSNNKKQTNSSATEVATSDVMSSMAAVVPGQQNSSVGPVKNNNFNPAAAIATSHSNPALSANAAVNSGGNNVASDLYAINPAFMAAAAAASYQFLNNEQQQILEVFKIYFYMFKIEILINFYFCS